MDVYIIEPRLTASETDENKNYKDIVKQQIEKYIPVNLVGENNINRYIRQIEKDAIIVLFCDASRDIESSSDVYRFLEKAKEKEALIWPVAMTKDSRIPPNIVSDRQSYDVSEQLRCRNLNQDYMGSIAKAFARKIIARAVPTIYDEAGVLFVSHRRLDGEELTAKLCDQLELQSRDIKTFRDVTTVQVGAEAQKQIDIAMSKSDAFIFIHTEKSAESDWIQKELRYAILRNIPVLWIQIDDAKISGLKITPTEHPHLKYSSSEFENDARRVEIADEVLQRVFEMIMSRNNKIFDYLESIDNLFGSNLQKLNPTQMLYVVSVMRKGYRYPQRKIIQYIQLFGKTPTDEDVENLQKLVTEDNIKYDSMAILTDRIVNREINGNFVKESFKDYYDSWYTYFKGEHQNKELEIIVSGAFPDGEEIYKQSLTDALVIFAKAIIKRGYTLTFGSHPTFQELFFEIAKELGSDVTNKKIKMYISKYYEGKYKDNKEHLLNNAELIEIEKEETCVGSLSKMRAEMIQRSTVSAMICMGGKIKDNKAEEGIREEIRIAQSSGIPVFIVGTVGGCSAVVASEFQSAGWQKLNEAPTEINDMLMNSLDYFDAAQKLLDIIDN